MRYAQGVTDRIIDVSENVEVSVCGEEPIDKSYVNTKTLTSIIQSSPFRDSEVHYLNIDCEGMDFEVLTGLDFDLYRPHLISIECHNEQTIEEIKGFLSPYEYKLSDRVHLTVFFKQISSS